MWRPSTVTLGRILALAVVILVLKVTLSVVVGYRAYFPPDFEAEFLLGREAYFFGAYQWAFYAHLVAGPMSLIAGTVLVSDWFCTRLPRWHRRVGKLLIGCVLLILVPSGLWMAPYAATGAVAGAGLGLLAVATATCAIRGWRAAVGRQFGEHRRWMWRLYLLLCSAVVIRVLGGLATVLGFDAEWVYPASVWLSWVGPLVAFELWRKRQEGMEQEATEGTEEGRKNTTRSTGDWENLTQRHRGTEGPVGSAGTTPSR
jgi:hypothetical protein